MRIKNKGNKIAAFFSFYLPHFLIFFGLIFLVSFSFLDIFASGKLQTIIITYLSIIAITFTLASVLFSYSSACEKEEKENNKLFGELFLLVGLFLIMAFLVNYVVFEMHSFLNTRNLLLFRVLDYVSYLFFGIGQAFLLFAAIYFSSGLKHLERILFFKVKNNKFIDFDKL